MTDSVSSSLPRSAPEVDEVTPRIVLVGEVSAVLPGCGQAECSVCRPANIATISHPRFLAHAVKDMQPQLVVFAHDTLKRVSPSPAVELASSGLGCVVAVVGEGIDSGDRKAYLARHVHVVSDAGKDSSTWQWYGTHMVADAPEGSSTSRSTRSSRHARGTHTVQQRQNTLKRAAISSLCDLYRVSRASLCRWPAPVAVSLTPQELLVCELAWVGQSDRQIGRLLRMSPREVATVFHQLTSRLNTASRLTALALLHPVEVCATVEKPTLFTSDHPRPSSGSS